MCSSPVGTPPTSGSYQLCKERSIDLVIDVAQSLGAMPVYPKKMNIAAGSPAGSGCWVRSAPVFSIPSGFQG